MDTISRTAFDYSGNYQVQETQNPDTRERQDLTENQPGTAATEDRADISDEANEESGLSATSDKDAGSGKEPLMLAWNPGEGNELDGMLAFGDGKQQGNPLEKDMSTLLGNRQHIPKSSETDYFNFDKDMEKFAQKHHSRKDISNFYDLRKQYQEEMKGMEGKDLSPDQVRHRTDLKNRLDGMNTLEQKLAVYNLDNYDQKKVQSIRNDFAQYEKLAKSDPGQAGQYLDKFVGKYAQDGEGKKIIKTLCYDAKDKNVGQQVFDKAANVESQQIFKNLQQSFPRGGGRGSCGACADQVEEALKGMDTQFHSWSRIQGTSPCTHIATELVQNKFDGSQSLGAGNNIVLDMWWRGKNFGSGFEGLDYNAFLNPATSDPKKMGAYWRNYWPITNGVPSDGSKR